MGDDVLIVGGVICGVIFCCTMMCVFSHSEDKSELQTPLLASNDSAGPRYRREAASRDAGEGFNACAFCGFENFKRFQFCNLCGTALPVAPQSTSTAGTAAKSRSGGGGGGNEVAFVPAEVLANATARQRRARSRKAWVRRMSSDDTTRVVWFQDPALNQQANLRFPGYALRFHQEAATPSPEQLMVTTTTSRISRSNSSVQTAAKVEIVVIPQENDAGQVIIEIGESDRPLVLTKDAVVQSLEVEVAFQALLLAEASVADAAQMSIAVVNDSNGTDQKKTDWKETLKLSVSDFPTKFSYFVATMAGLQVVPTKQYVRLNIRREMVLQDSMEAMSIVPHASIQSAMRIEFLVERGVDAGGLQREWFMLLNLALAEPQNGVFKCIDMAEQIFYLNPNSAHDIGEDHLMYYFATGRLVGRSLLEGQVLNFHLTLPLLKIILGIPISFPDLEFFDPEAYKSLLWIMNNSGVGNLGIDFSVTEKRGDKMVVIDLIENGRNIDVDDDNKDLYLERKFRYLLFESVSSQLFAFLKGLYEVIPQELLALFDPEEFDYMLCGSDDIDVDDWEKNTVVSASLQTQEKALKWFWEFVRSMPNEYRRRLLHFATGTSRVPLGGFGSLTSVDGRLCRFTLKGVKLEESEYIASHACFNQLEIPLYESREKMESVLFATLELELHGFTTD